MCHKWKVFINGKMCHKWHVINVMKMSQMAKCATNGKDMSQMAKIFHKWQNVPQLAIYISNGKYMYQMAKICHKWHKCVQTKWLNESWQYKEIRHNIYNLVWLHIFAIWLDFILMAFCKSIMTKTWKENIYTLQYHNFKLYDV